MASKFKNNETVADDINWRAAVSNEEKSARQWEEDWGFLASESGQSGIDQRISEMEAKLKSMDKTGDYRTTS
jgi:hypothetical protein